MKLEHTLTPNTKLKVFFKPQEKRIREGKKKDQEKKPKPKPAEEKKPGSIEGIDFGKVKEVDFIRHDQHVGTATMATSLFNDAMKKAGKTIPVKAVRINELDDDASHLVIVTPAANKNLAVRYSNIQTLVVNDLLKDKKLTEAIQNLH